MSVIVNKRFEAEAGTAKEANLCCLSVPKPGD
jgi:hypothetical protein